MNYLASLFLSMGVFLSAIQAALPAAPVTEPKVEVYSMPGCIGCGLAKSMFESRNIPFKEVNVSGRENKPFYDEMIKRAGGKPGDQMGVPQIFINGRHMGGYMDVSSDDLDKLQADLPENEKK